MHSLRKSACLPALKTIVINLEIKHEKEDPRDYGKNGDSEGRVGKAET